VNAPQRQQTQTRQTAGVLQQRKHRSLVAVAHVYQEPKSRDGLDCSTGAMSQGIPQHVRGRANNRRHRGREPGRWGPAEGPPGACPLSDPNWRQRNGERPQEDPIRDPRQYTRGETEPPSPAQLRLCEPDTPSGTKYGRSGTSAPTARADPLPGRPSRLRRGNTAAGCARVNGISWSSRRAR
jgi:hypothetical protein